MANASEVVPSALGVAEPPDITDAKPIAPEEKAWSSINIAGTEMVGARDAGVPESGQSSWGSERASNDSDTHFFDDRERGSLRGKDIPRLHCDEDGWVQRTCELLHQYGYVILTLPPDEASLVHDMYDAALDAFDSQTARHQLGVYERDRPRLDGRSGYMSDREREFFELHDRVPHDLETRAEAPRASHLLDVCTRYSSACRKRCYAILEALSGGPDTPLGRYMAAEAAGASGDVRLVGYKSSMMRVYQYDLAPPRVSDFRDDGDPHHDMGLLTLIPRSTFSGLDVQLPPPTGWLEIEREMRDCDAVLFGGLSLARLTGIPALYHRVKLQHKHRVSAPYFLRASLRVVLPASPGFEPQDVSDYNDALRDAGTYDVHADGHVVVRERRMERREAPYAPWNDDPKYNKAGRWRPQAAERGVDRNPRVLEWQRTRQEDRSKAVEQRRGGQWR